jgi:hypothetical protein
MDEKYYTTPNGTIVGESTLRSKYGEKFDSFLSDGKITEVAETIYETPNGILVQESVLKDKYGEKFNTFLSDGKLKKKESTEPTQPVQEAPLQGLGGVSEEPLRSPSVGQGVLRDVDQTQPRGEAFISRASDLTRTDVREPKVDGEKKPTQAAPLEGLGGVSEKPTPPSSAGQGVLRYVDQTQPTGEEFVSQVSEGVLDQAPVEADVSAEKKEPEWLIDLLGRDANKYESVDETLNQIEGEKKDLDELESLGFETQEQIDSYNKRVNRFNESIKSANQQISENDRYQAEQGEIERISSLLENPKPLKNPLDSYDELEREALDIAGIDAPTQLEARAKEQQRVQTQSASNNTLFGIDEPNEFLEDYTELPPPNYIKTDNDLKLYLSSQIGEVKRRVNQVMSDPEAYGFPKRIMSANEEDIQQLTNELYRQAQVKKESPQYSSRSPLTDGAFSTPVPLPIESQGEDFVNLDESYFRKVAKSAIVDYQANFNNVKYERLLNAMSRDYAKAGYDEKQTKAGFLGELSSQEKWGNNEKTLYDLNNELKSARNQLASSSPESPKYQSIQQNYNELLLKAEDARKELGSDREAFYDMRTGERVDKLDSPHVMDLTMQIQDEMEKLSFEENIEDVYIRAGLEDNEHKSYGQNTKHNIKIPLTRTGKADQLIHRQAIELLTSRGYKSETVDGKLFFNNVSLSDISNAYVRNAVDKTDDKLAEDAERWHDRNVDLMSKRISARNMSLLNIDPGPVEKGQFTIPLLGDIYVTRMLEVIGETALPKGAAESIGMSDVKFVDLAMSQLESHGIELTDAQKENAKRSLGLEVQEGFASFVPMIAELAVANKATGAVKLASGFKKILDGWRAGSKFERGLAIASEALIEEGTMQAVGMKPGAGATFNILGNRFRKYGLDKFPLRFKGELARLNKIGDSVWSNALTGTITMEAAATMEAAIDDFAGGETMQNYLEENYSNLSEVGKRQIVNAWVFNIIGGRGLIGKGKSGLRIRRMEEARDDLQKNGETAEADVLTGYIKEYYAGKKTSWEVQLTPEEKSAIRNRMARAGETGDVEIQEWFSKNPEEGKKVLKKGVVSVGTFDKIKSLFGIRPEIIRDLSESKVEKVGENYEVKLLTDGKEVGSYKTESKEEAEAVSNEINADLKEKESVVETAPAVTEPTGDTVPAKQKGRLTKFSTPQDGIVGEVTYEDGTKDGTKKELTQEEYDALEKQEGLFDVETGTQPVAETPVEETVSAPTEVAEEAAPKELSPKQKEAYNGLTKEEKQAVDELIFDEQYELSIGAKDVEKPKYLTKEESAIWDYEDKIAKESINYEDALNNALGIVSEKQKADGEVFTFGQDKYNIDKAVNLANTEGIEPIEIGIETTPKLRMPFVLKTEEGIENADLSKPVIIATTKDGLMLIDGHHRLEKAIREGKPVKAQILSESQTLKIKQDAVQKQAAGKVPVQPEAKAGEKVEEGKPKTEAEKPTQEGKEVLSEEDAKSEEKVKEFVEENLSDEKKKEEADNEIESKSEEELKEDVPDVLESISETEREKLDREAKFKGKSTVDYVIDYLKGKLKNVRQSIKNILEKIKSNYRKAIITTAVIASVVKGSDVKIGGTSLRDVFKDATELVVTEGKSQGENLALDLAVENPEAFKSIWESYGENKYLDAIAEKAGLGKVEVFEVEKVEVSEVTPKDTVNVEALRKIIKKNDGKLNQKVEIKPGVTFISYRNTFLAEEGQEYVIIGRRDEREAAGNKDIEGVQYIAHHTLDDQMVGNERGGNSGFHNASMKMDGYVPYTLKRQVNKETGEVREIITYKKYSEIADTSKGIGEILSTDQKIGSPIRQFKFGDIDWDAKPKWTSNKEREKKGYSGSRVMKTSVELLLKPGKKNPYRTGGLSEKDPYGNYMNPRGTHILYLGGNNKGSLGEAYKGAIGKYNGGSFVYIFDYKGKTIVREVGSSVSQLKEEGDAIIKQFGVNPNDLTLGYHDVGSVSAKLGAENGKLGEKQFGVVNKTNPYAGGGLAIPIENKIPRDEPGDAPIGLMALPLLFAGTGRKRRRKPLEDADADKVVTEWMGDVQKIYDAQKTKNKEEARNQAAVNLALSGKLDNLAPDQVKAVLEGIQTETDAMGKKWSVSTLSELEGLTIKEQFKQGFEEYVAAMKQKESDKIQKAKETAQGKIDAVKERTAKAVEKIKAKKEAEKIEYKDKIEKLKKESKADKEARELFEAIVNDIAKDAGLSQISRKKASELLKSSRDVNAENIERLLEKAVRVIEYEYKRNIVKESDKKIKDLNTNIKKNKFGTLTQSAKELAGITTEDIPIGLLPRFVDVMDGVSKKSPSAKDLEELAKFMSEFKNELDKQITDIQSFADVLNDFKTQEETEKIDDYLKENGFSESQIEFFKKNRKAINAAYNSFYTKEGKDLTAQEKAQKVSEQMLEAKKVFREMEANGESKVDMKKFKGKVQQEVNIAEFFNNIKESDIDYLTRTEANKIPVLFDNLNRGMVTNATFKIMNRIKGGRKLDSFEKLDAKSPIKRVKTKDDLFKSFVSNAGEIAKLDRVLDPATLKSSGELTKDIEKKVLDYADEVIKGLKGKPLYEEISKVIRPLVNANTRTARVQEKANELFDKMDGSPLHNTTIMSVYFRSREFDLNPDNAKIRNPLDYINKTLESPNLSEKKRAVLKGIRNEYFRNGKPLTKDMLSFIEKSKGGPLIEFMDEVMSESKDDVRFMSEVIESSPVEFFMGYQPRSTIEGRQSIEDLLSDVSNNVGRPSLKTSAVKSRETGVNALNFDAMDDFMRTAASIDLQRSIAPALSELNAFISEASRSGNADAKIFADTLKKVVESYVKNTLSRDYKQKGIFANIFSSMGRKLKKNTLAGISKATVESIIQLGKIHIDEDASNAFYKNASMKRDVNNQQVLEAFNSIHVARAGVLSSEMSRKRSYITDAVRRGDASKAEELIYSASKTIPGRVVSGVDDFMGDFNTALIKFPDLIGTVQCAIGGAAIRFKEITGKELDFDKLVKDPEYRAKYKDELEASIAYGDQLATRMGGPGSMEQKSLQDIKGGELWDMNRFVRSFSTNENEQILSALTTLGVPTLSKITGRNKGRQRGAEFENKRKAASGLASSLFGLGAYTSFRIALGTLILGMFSALLNGDDWDEEFDNWDWDVFNARVLGDTVWTALFGKLGVIESLVMQSVIAYGVRQSYKANGKEELGDKIADGMFYSTVSQDDKATKEWKMLGPEGKLLGSVLETVYVLADAAENDDFDLLSSPSSKNNIYTIAKGVMNLGAAQDVGTGVRKMWYGRDENRKVRESFGKGGDSKIVNEVEKEVLRLYKETGESSVIPSMIKDKPRKITEKGVSIDIFIHGFSVKELQRLKGDFIRSEVEGLIKTRDYKNVSDSNKIKLLKSVYDNWNRSESINRVSRGKYESIDDFYKHDDNILKFERSLR